MSSVALWNSLATNGLPAAVSAAPARLSPPPLSVVSACRVSHVRKPQVITICHRPTRPSFLVQAVADDELGSEKKALKGALGGLAVVEEETNGAASVIPELKRKLIDQLFGTDRGLKATSETRAEVNEIISQLEAKNPTPAPTEALSLLNGKWILAYTSFVGLFPLLGAGSLTQLVKVDEISQTIDSEALTVQNSVRFVGPFSTTSVSTNAKFEVRSPKRVQIKFEEGIVGTPQLTDSIVIPEKVEIFGQNIDLSPFKGVISSLNNTASSVAKTISSQPPLKFPISNTNAQSWLLTTYLDDELRISRGDGGSVYVLVKEGSPLLG
ncbi:chromoplast-specific carotenoid-associated protein C1, chromoplastic-like [Phalaenopsis equestris]|uniref:chromoplast-specific carotenoid-associated protein C1, chromoplastic-like n=1 Tax=Phalaenopsis equestris TaxID=78828 RepID=UPI0009E35B72|nr:chromoplast-specific carotenoid-associated protein C1, chromoplastic-like [Phalaenopsis equestris]